MLVDNPLVSVIIPVFNAEKYIAETIQSVLNQTWQNIEIIIVDDGSIDTSVAKASAFNTDRIKIFKQQNKGASAARNKGLAEAKGDYIQYLDADDLLKSDKIATQVNQLWQYNDAISVCPVIHFDSNNAHDLLNLKPNLHELGYYNDSNVPFEFLLKLYGAENNRGSMIPIHCWLTPATLIRKAGSWNESLTINDDGEFFCRVLLQAKQILVAHQTACYYRKHITNLSLSAGKGKKSLESQYLSIALRTAHLKSFKPDKRIDKIAVYGLMELLMITYPQYKDLSNKILADIQQYDVPAVAPPLGGKIAESIKKLFGWKTARLLQYYYANIVRK
jgi:glycosyltransferase involved in cell wall biosynthesis